MRNSRRTLTGRFQRGRQNPWTPDRWNDGYTDPRGRFRVYRPDFPHPYQHGYALRAQVVWWLATGATPLVGCILHHINEDKLDDRFENLRQVTRTEHMRLHHGRPPIRRVCPVCARGFVVSAAKARTSLGRYCGSNCRTKGARR